MHWLPESALGGSRIHLRAPKITKIFWGSMPQKDVTSAESSTPDGKMIKLPKLNIPTFDGNILCWLTFWEQYRVAIHDRSDLSQAQKLVYLWQALKDGSAKNVIEGLSRSGEQYEEAVKCLQEQYDRPRLIHQAHVRRIVELPNLKDDSGRELCRLHDVLQQHLRALKAMDKEPSVSFITLLIEMKLDPSTMFEWQKESQDSTDVPHYTKLLEFQSSTVRVCIVWTKEESKSWQSCLQETPTKQIYLSPYQCLLAVFCVRQKNIHCMHVPVSRPCLVTKWSPLSRRITFA